jgi:hypothetical protein
MKVRIYKPAKNAMQSGRARTAGWVLEYETVTPRRAEPLMGWISSGDTLNQVKLNFETMEEAVAFARKKGWEFTLQTPHARKIRPRNYTDNFRYIPPAEKV